MVKIWYRSPGTVFQEWSENGERRAVKDIANDTNSGIKIDNRWGTDGDAVLAKVRDMKASTTAVYLLALADHSTA